MNGLAGCLGAFFVTLVGGLILGRVAYWLTDYETWFWRIVPRIQFGKMDE